VEQPELEQQIRAAWEGGDMERAATMAIEGYGPKTLGVLAALMSDEDDAREVFQQWCLKLWQGLPSFQWGSKVSTWAYRICHNERVNFQRKRSRARSDRLDTHQADQLAQSLWTRTRPYQKTTIKNRFAELREQLKPDDRELLILRVDMKMSWKEIAEALSRPDAPVRTNTLEKRFSRVKERLRELAEKEGLLGGGD
jgi:RNA polymerase sigma-70 factor (ECF subfamily)